MESEQLIMETMAGATVSMFSFRNGVGIISRGHDEDFMSLTVSKSVAVVIGLNEVSWEGGIGHSSGAVCSADNCCLIPSILFTKCCRNSSHFSGEASRG